MMLSEKIALILAIIDAEGTIEEKKLIRKIYLLQESKKLPVVFTYSSDGNKSAEVSLLLEDAENRKMINVQKECSTGENVRYILSCTEKGRNFFNSIEETKPCINSIVQFINALDKFKTKKKISADSCSDPYCNGICELCIFRKVTNKGDFCEHNKEDIVRCRDICNCTGFRRKYQTSEH